MGLQELGGKSGAQPATRRVQLLEVSQYLENYLWPNFDAKTSTTEHLLSIVLMLNEKFREGIPPWGGLRTDAPKFESFFQRFFRLKVRRSVCGKDREHVMMGRNTLEVSVELMPPLLCRTSAS